jgi:hypothetical protein
VGKGAGYLVLLLVAYVSFVHAAYITAIPPKDEECFFIPAPPGGSGATLYGNFDLLDDGIAPDPLSVVVIDAKEAQILYRSRRRSKEGIFKVELKPDQKVNLCLQNGIVTAGGGRKSVPERTHDGLDRTVGFQFSVEPKNEAKELKSQNEKLIEASRDLTREIKNLYNHHEYMRTREAKHREVVEKTFSQLMYWIILEGVTVMLIAAGQIMYFRRFLERRRYI